MEKSQHIQNAIHLPCPSCGSQLRYSAKAKKISCDYCGYLEDIDDSTDKVVEQSLSNTMSLVKDYVPEEVGKKVFDCGSCGAKFMVESDRLKVSCGFCGSTNVNLEAFDHQCIQPVGIIPFYISRDEATSSFKKWIRRGWFHPSKLKSLAAMEDLHGVYIPFWTYDAKTESEWSGQAGHYYYETEQVRIKGRMQTKKVQKVRWHQRSGRLSHFFDDILVAASRGLEQRVVERILPFRLGEVVNFDARLMVGWEAEIYQIEVDEAYHIADLIMDDKIRHMCSAQLGGDTQRNLHVSSSKSGQTFKHIILPIWISSYMYNNKIYHFTINGQTGKVYGNKPISWLKIAILVLIFVLFMVGVWYLRHSGLLRN